TLHCPHLCEQSRSEAVAENVVHHRRGEEIGIVHAPTRQSSYYRALRRIFFVDEVDAAFAAYLGRRHLRTLAAAALPATEGMLDLRAHRRRIEIAPCAENDALGLIELLVKRDQVVARDRVDGGVFRLVREGAVLPVHRAVVFTPGDTARIVVATIDT